MSRRRSTAPLRRDVLFLTLGAGWGTWTVWTEGPWPIMLISAAVMLGPGFLRLWLSAPGTRGSLSLPEPEQPALSDLSSPTSSAPASEADPA